MCCSLLALGHPWVCAIADAAVGKRQLVFKVTICLVFQMGVEFGREGACHVY